MRKINVLKWKVKSPTGEDIEDNSLTVLNAVINNTKPEEMPRGIDQFRLFNRLDKAFKQAEETGTIVLEEVDYHIMKRLLELGIPAIWAMNKDINGAVEGFLNAKEE